MIGSSIDWILDGVVAWVARALLSAFTTLLGVLEHVLLSTPDVTGLPQVRALSGRSVWIVDTCFVLVFIAVGVTTMVSGSSEKARYTVKDLLARAIVGLIAAHFAILLCFQAILAANAITAAVTDQQVPAVDALKAIRLNAGGGTPAVLLTLVVYAIIVVLLATTTVQAIARIALVLVLTAVAPLALACHALPATDPAARLWWRAYAGSLAIPLAQAVTLQAGAWMLLDPTHMLPGIPITDDPSSTANLLIVIVLLWSTVKVPGLMRRFVFTSSRGPHLIATVVRVVVLQRVARAIPGLGRGLRRAIP